MVGGLVNKFLSPIIIGRSILSISYFFCVNFMFPHNFQIQFYCLSLLFLMAMIGKSIIMHRNDDRLRLLDSILDYVVIWPNWVVIMLHTKISIFWFVFLVSLDFVIAASRMLFASIYAENDSSKSQIQGISLYHYLVQWLFYGVIIFPILDKINSLSVARGIICIYLMASLSYVIYRFSQKRILDWFQSS